MRSPRLVVAGPGSEEVVMVTPSRDGAADGRDPSANTGRGRPAPAPVRWVELGLLVVAACVTTLALVSVELNLQHTVGVDTVYLGLGYLGLFALAHLAVWRWAPYADPLILPCVAALTGIGLVMIHRLDLATDGVAALGTGAPVVGTNAPRQLGWAAASLVLLVVGLWRLRDERRLARYAYLCGLAGLVLLVLPGLLPSSISQVNGAKLWIRLGPFSLQPGEFAKLLVIVFMAALLSQKRELFATAGRRVFGIEFPRGRDLAPLLVTWLLAVGVLVLEKELGASLLFFGTVLAMIYIATERVSWVIIGLVFFAVGCVTAYSLFAHVAVRVTVWENPFADYANTGYQMSQSLFGLGTGGLGGSGLGAGRPDLVPLANTDFIVAGLGEELGLIGLTAVVLIYLLLVVQGMRAALLARSGFSTILAAGLSFALALQVFIVVGGVTGLLPETGLTAPFLSYGGSSLLANYLLAGVLLRVSDRSRRPVVRRERPATPLADAATEMTRRPAR